MSHFVRSYLRFLENQYPKFQSFQTVQNYLMILIDRWFQMNLQFLQILVKKYPKFQSYQIR
jgi:hypothetical protein